VSEDEKKKKGERGLTCVLISPQYPLMPGPQPHIYLGAMGRLRLTVPEEEEVAMSIKRFN
jgi:hypothetical protein